LYLALIARCAVIARGKDAPLDIYHNLNEGVMFRRPRDTGADLTGDAASGWVNVGCR
jgi:hypothetical protein